MSASLSVPTCTMVSIKLHSRAGDAVWGRAEAPRPLQQDLRPVLLTPSSRITTLSQDDSGLF